MFRPRVLPAPSICLAAALSVAAPPPSVAQTADTPVAPETTAEQEAARLAEEAVAAAEAGRLAQEAAAAQAAAEAEARRAIVAAEIARLAAEREAARLAAEEEAVRVAAEQEAARLAEEAAAAAEAGRLAQEAAAEQAAAEAEARRAIVAAEIARLAAEREAARLAAEQEASRRAEEAAARDAAVAACMETAGPASAEVPVSEAAQSAVFARLRAALTLCEDAVALAPESGGPLFHLATVAQARGEHREAVALYERAAAAGVGAAQTRLGDYYNFGIGPIRPDIDRAVEAYRAATAAGDPAGMATLAFMHRLGRGVARDPAEMVRLFHLAVDEGYHFAQATLAQTYLTGEGVPGGTDAGLGIPNPRAAVPLFAAAARSGNMDAALALSELYAEGADGVPPNANARLRWTRVAAGAGHPPAIAALAFLQEQGIGMAADPVAAAQGYIAALETGAVDADDLRAAGGPRPPFWDRQTAIEFQLILQERGLYRGPIDGLVGPGTLAGARAVAD